MKGPRDGPAYTGVCRNNFGKCYYSDTDLKNVVENYFLYFKQKPKT